MTAVFSESDSNRHTGPQLFAEKPFSGQTERSVFRMATAESISRVERTGVQIPAWRILAENEEYEQTDDVESPDAIDSFEMQSTGIQNRSG